jgi:hypothetical protein
VTRRTGARFLSNERMKFPFARICTVGCGIFGGGPRNLQGFALHLVKYKAGGRSLCSLLKQSPAQIAAHLEGSLAADTLVVQNEQQVFEAAFALRRGAGEFEDALIGMLCAWAGCSQTLTFDRKAGRLKGFRAIG